MSLTNGFHLQHQCDYAKQVYIGIVDCKLYKDGSGVHINPAVVFQKRNNSAGKIKLNTRFHLDFWIRGRNKHYNGEVCKYTSTYNDACNCGSLKKIAAVCQPPMDKSSSCSGDASCKVCASRISCGYNIISLTQLA